MSRGLVILLIMLEFERNIGINANIKELENGSFFM